MRGPRKSAPIIIERTARMHARIVRAYLWFKSALSQLLFHLLLDRNTLLHLRLTRLQFHAL